MIVQHNRLMTGNKSSCFVLADNRCKQTRQVTGIWVSIRLPINDRRRIFCFDFQRCSVSNFAVNFFFVDVKRI